MLSPEAWDLLEVLHEAHVTGGRGVPAMVLPASAEPDLSATRRATIVRELIRLEFALAIEADQLAITDKGIDLLKTRPKR